MTDKKRFVEELNTFLKSDSSNVLITGLDEDEKIVITLAVLHEEMSKGTMYVNGLTQAGNILNRAFNRYDIPFSRNIAKGKSYSLDSLQYKFENYSKKLLSYEISVDDDFALFYPVQIALQKEKMFTQLTDHLKASRAKKTIIITTNDHFIDTSKLEPFVDKRIHYECKNDNPKLYKNIKNYINNKISSPYSSYKLNPIYESLIE